MVTVGRIVRPHGRRGEVVVLSESDFAEERFTPGATLHWRRGEAIEPIVVTSSRSYDARWVVGLAGLESIDDAEAVRGLELKIPTEALHALAPGAYYTHDLVGCRVETTAGATVGTVGEVMFGAGAPMLVVGAPDGEVLVPMVEGIWQAIDLGTRTIVIDPPAGLLDVNRRT
ncbi:MAG TPA: ribosome maturation factor RimM [Vicinamibacterales bacterium]|nr:ribosome maturation factor RimM [Vicinamibacterales bacterium]